MAYFKLKGFDPTPITTSQSNILYGVVLGMKLELSKTFAKKLAEKLNSTILMSGFCTINYIMNLMIKKNWGHTLGGQVRKKIESEIRINNG